MTGQARADDNWCTSGTTTWIGGADANWGTGQTNTTWSNGFPDSSCDAVINGPDTVTLTNTFGANQQTANGVGVAGLTLEGGATLIVEGESVGVQGNWSNQTGLTIGNDGITIASGSTLDLEATDNTAQALSDGEVAGASASMEVDAPATTFTNDGTITASTTDAAHYNESIGFGVTMTDPGNIDVQSGTLTFQGSNGPMVVDNTGTVSVAAGATLAMNAGDGSSFTNAGGGSYVNAGTTTLQSSMDWTQSGGTETGNPIELTGGETLVDSAGSSGFLVNGTSCGGASITGTIPQGQTVTVEGMTVGCSGNVSQDAQLSAGSGSTGVTNDGTINLDADGSGTASGGSALLVGNQIANDGTINADITDPSFKVYLQTPLVNEPGGTFTLSGGELDQTTGTATTNDGTVEIGSGANWLVQGGSFTNAGVLAPQITGSGNYGKVTLNVESTFNAGGALAPVLSGYTPAVGTEFPLIALNGGSFSGTFASVTGGFSADYSNETASSPYVGVIYDRAASGGGGSGTGGGGAKPGSSTHRPTVVKLRGGVRAVTVKLSCSKKVKSCAAYTITGIAGKKTVLKGHGTVKPGRTKTVVIRLDKAARKLLKHSRKLKVKVTVRTGGKTIKTVTVTVTRPR